MLDLLISNSVAQAHPATMPHPLMRMVLLPLLLLVTAVASWDIDVVVTQEASGAVGGESFAVQPRVEVRNLKGILQTSILGTVSAELIESPSGYELLRRRNDDTDDGVEVERDDDDDDDDDSDDKEIDL